MARDEYERGRVVFPTTTNRLAHVQRRLRDATNAIHAAGRAAADSFFNDYCDRNADWPTFRQAIDAWTSATDASGTLPAGTVFALAFLLQHRKTPHVPDWWDDQRVGRHPQPHRRVTKRELTELFPVATASTNEFDASWGTIVVGDRRIAWSMEGNHCFDQLEDHPVYRALIDALDRTEWTSHSGGVAWRADEYSLEDYGNAGGWTRHASWGNSD